ncbi:SAM-dependent methyltransferase [Secundilactobacillus paracollinoides]|uniref:class I SAM-dependent DNA methyltransferase n=1 Tax=Secundilactobacillus paracollinoides TaxID=240427 RepID=UPI0006EFE958|nr:class I SAM-dependent methyltransferase [Secundilactobacillus paracollinoides]ANZ63879.1 SAM-dependent methyltransferase [Secundilactobacillus paracollinoides]KRL76380.1 methyltransferase [Secundilactobacillus paracollinoides DSM 15502 = JCM 11969]
MIYQTFAKLYDELFDPQLYADWAAFTRQTVRQPDQPLLELACGTGRLAVQLAQAGFDVTGFDLSEEMLTLADQHVREADVALPLIQGNMLDLSELPVYQTVTCYADSLCYLPDETALQTVFEQVAGHLTTTGQFLFDVITPHQTDDVYPGYMYNYRDEDRAFLWSSDEADEPHAVEHDLTFFTYNSAKDAYDEVSELHHERTYELSVYRQLLQAAGFNRVTVSADFGRQQPDAQTTRWFFVCEKGDGQND